MIRSTDRSPRSEKIAIVASMIAGAVGALWWSFGVLNGQAAPATEVYLAPLTISASSVTVGAPVNISNNKGYDNQPAFLPDSSGVLFTSNRDEKQNDIYRWDIAKKSLTQLTHTDENEYSPLVSPDSQSFVAVHGTEQSLFRYDLDGKNPRLAYQHGKELIGYHVWITDTEIAAFVLGANGAPNTLQVIDTKSGKSETLASNIGRSLLLRPGAGTVSFVEKPARPAGARATGAAEPAQPWLIKQFDIKTHKLSTLAETMKGSEDLTWLPDGKRLLMGLAGSSKLSLWTEGTGWTEIADVSVSAGSSAGGITKLTRLSASRDGKWLAFVGEPAK